MTHSVTLDRLFAEADRIRGNAYVPYSGFRVGAALIVADGAMFSGCNVENAAYPVGTCAEAGAIAAMVAAGKRLIAQIAVVGPGIESCMPCGGCRQRIREFANGNTLIHLRSAASGIETMVIEDLLPRAFGPDTLALNPRASP